MTVLALMATYALLDLSYQGQRVYFWTMTNRMAPPAFLLPLFLLFSTVFKFGDSTLFDTKSLIYHCVFNLPLLFIGKELLMVFQES